MFTPQKVRRLALTGAVVSITIAGTLYGAGIKTDQEVTKVTQKAREVTIDERIQSLRDTRQTLSSKKDMVEKQLRDLEVRIEDRKQKGIGGSNNQGPHDG